MPGQCSSKDWAPGPMLPRARCSPTWSAPRAICQPRPASGRGVGRTSPRRRSRRFAPAFRIRQHPEDGCHMSISLTLAQVKERARRAPMVPIFRDMLSDALTPVTAFAGLAGDGPAYLLESVERGEQLGRYSFVAADPMAILTIAGGRATVQDTSGRRELEGADPLRALEAYLQTYAAEPAEGLPEGFCGGAVGYLAYEAAGDLERRPKARPDPLQVCGAAFVITDK